MAHTVVYVHAKKLERANRASAMFTKAGHTCHSVVNVFPDPYVVVWCKQDVCTKTRASTHIPNYDEEECCTIL